MIPAGGRTRKVKQDRPLNSSDAKSPTLVLVWKERGCPGSRSCSNDHCPWNAICESGNRDVAKVELGWLRVALVSMQSALFE